MRPRVGKVENKDGMKVLLHNSTEKYLNRLNAKDRGRIKEALKDIWPKSRPKAT